MRGDVEETGPLNGGDAVPITVVHDLVGNLSRHRPIFPDRHQLIPTQATPTERRQPEGDYAPRHCWGRHARGRVR
ncbi:hypothetical protein GCM10027610_010730 [Dactylosporangium cerinum]